MNDMMNPACRPNAILIPAYKPDEKLVSLCDTLLLNDDLSIVVVDDGSGEEYQSVFKALDGQVKLISYPVNKGKGGALKTGIAYIYDNMPECQRIVTADADGQHTPDDIRKVINKSVEYPGALIIGGRRFDENNVPLRSRLGNSITRGVYRIVSGVKVYDTQTGLRGFDRAGMEIFRDMPGDRYEYEINVLLKAAALKIPMHEITIQTVYLEENQSSHFNPLKDSARIYKCIFAHAFRRMGSLIKFSASSLIAFGIDELVLILLCGPNGGGLMSASVGKIVARLVSGAVNFFMNRRFVFAGDEVLWKAALKYAALWAFVLACDWLLFNKVLVGLLHIPIWIANPVSQTLVFLCINYPIQKRFVYTKQK